MCIDQFVDKSTNFWTCNVYCLCLIVERYAQARYSNTLSKELQFHQVVPCSLNLRVGLKKCSMSHQSAFGIDGHQDAEAGHQGHH